MKKPYLKNNNFILRRGVVFILIIAALFINSCKKDPLTNQQAATLETAGYMKDYQPVNPDEVASWLRNNLSADQQAQLQLSKSQQSVINQHHVVRIPIGKDAALFFTKTGGKMQVYAYKWLNKKPANKSYTGYIAAYSFENRNAKQFVYSDSKKIRENYLQVRTNYSSLASTSGTGTGLAPATTQPQTSAASVGEIFGRFWCWLTGGEYVSQDDIDNGNSAGANGEVGKVGCDYKNEVATVDYDDLTGGGIFSWGGGGSFSPGAPAGSGPAPTGGGSTGYGDGSYWVNVYVPSQGCCTDPHVPCTTLCEEAHWDTYTVINPQAIEDLISKLHTSTLTADELANFKNTINTMALTPTGNKILTALDTYYKNNSTTAVTLTITHNTPATGGTDEFVPGTHTINMGYTYSPGNFLSYMVYSTAHEIYHEYETINTQSPLYSNFEADAYMFAVQVTKEAPQDFGSSTYENLIAKLPVAPSTPTQAQTAFHTAWTNFLNGTTSAFNYANIINNFLTGSTVGPNYTTYTGHPVTNNPTVMPLFLQ